MLVYSCLCPGRFSIIIFRRWKGLSPKSYIWRYSLSLTFLWQNEKSFFEFRVLIRSITNIMKIVFLDLLKPKGLHFGCNLISEIPNYSISTYKRDFTGRERNKKLDLFTTAPMNNPYTWSNYTNMMNRCTKVSFLFVK